MKSYTQITKFAPLSFFARKSS